MTRGPVPARFDTWLDAQTRLHHARCHVCGEHYRHAALSVVVTLVAGHLKGTCR